MLRDNPPQAHPAPDKAYWLQRPLYNRTRPETLAVVARLRALLDRYPERMAVAEIAAEDQIGAMIDYTDGPDRYQTAYSFVLLREAFGAAVVRSAMEDLLARSTTAWPSWAFSNHDVVRVVSRWGGTHAGDPALARLLVALLCSLRGTIFLYQGEELGLPQADVPFERLRDPEGKTFWPRHRGRDGARTPMPWRAEAPHAGFSSVEPWLPVDPRHPPLAVDRQDADPDSVLTFTRAFLAWRKSHPALIRGTIRFFDLPPLLAFERTAGPERLLCMFNVGREERTLPLDIAEVTVLDVPGAAGTLEGGVVRLPGWGSVFATVSAAPRLRASKR